jgi:hypothetical protein
MRRYGRFIKYGLSVLLTYILASCNTSYNESVDVSVVAAGSNTASKYYVRFTDDMNLNYADAFDSEVNSISLFAFDTNGTLVWQKTESGSDIHPEDASYEMNISELSPGDYTLVAWGDLENNTSFTIPNMINGVSTLDELTCRLERTRSIDDEKDVVDTRLTPIFHAISQISIPEEADESVQRYKMQLTKDTKNITVVLQQLDGDRLNTDDYEFIIEADNGHLNYDNNLITNEEPFIYKAWYVKSTDLSAVVAYLNTSRLMQSTAECSYTRPMLTVRKSSDKSTILSIPIIDYALMIRSDVGRATTDQEYLDRQSDYSMTFFLQDGKWVSAVIIINDWRIVINNDNIE